MILLPSHLKSYLDQELMSHLKREVDPTTQWAARKRLTTLLTVQDQQVMNLQCQRAKRESSLIRLGLPIEKKSFQSNQWNYLDPETMILQQDKLDHISQWVVKEKLSKEITVQVLVGMSPT